MQLELDGLDGSNPLAFLAALGVLATVGGRLAWVEHGAAWRPIITELSSDISMEQLADVLYSRLQAVPFAYTLAQPGEAPYEDFATRKKDPATTTVRLVDGETAFRAAIERAAIECQNSGDCAELERLAAHTCVLGVRKGSTTDVRSVSGPVRYLSNIRAIVEATTREDIARALFERWQYYAGEVKRKKERGRIKGPGKRPKLGLDPRAVVENVPVNIAGLGSISELGAERLALEGLRALPTSIHGGRLVTRGYHYRRGRAYAFRWVLSRSPRSLRTSSELLASAPLDFSPDGRDQGRAALLCWMRDLGVAALFESRLRYYGQGYKQLLPAVAIAEAGSSA